MTRSKFGHFFFEDMELTKLDFIEPIILLGNGWYLVRPKTVDDVKFIVVTYGGKLPNNHAGSTISNSLPLEVGFVQSVSRLPKYLGRHLEMQAKLSKSEF